MQLVADKDVVPGEAPRGTRESALPRWDGRWLYFRGVAVLHAVRQAPNQAALLNAFERVAWGREIEISPRDGVAGLKGERLRQTCSSLNRRLKAAGLIFERTADGKAVHWLLRQ